jgi:GNAT superfamily N-acetyltransferase
MNNMKKLPSDLQCWVDARKKFNLSHKQIQMARELGLNPKKFGHLDNHENEPWKEPLPNFIESIYFKRFAKITPDNIQSIEQLFSQRQAKKKEKQSKKLLMKAIEIKLLTQCQEHIPELASLWFEEISKHWVPNASVERATQNLIKHLNEDKMPMTLVAFVEGKPVGMASLRENDGIQSDLFPWLGSLVVHPNYRRRKIGEILINAIKKQAYDFGHKKMYLLAFEPTIPDWYTQLGWKKIGMDQYFDHPVTLMSIDLVSLTLVQ